MAELIKLPLGMVSGVVPRLDGHHAHCRHLANTVELLQAVATSGYATAGCDAACFQITLGNLVTVAGSKLTKRESKQ